MGGRVAVMLLLLAACGFEGKPSGVIDAARPDGTIDPDGGPDAAIDARGPDAPPDAPLSYAVIALRIARPPEARARTARA